MIELINVDKRYRRGKFGAFNTVLRDVNARFHKGHSYGILGANGVGKSTLLRLIAGSEQPNRGRVLRDVTVSWPMGFTGSFNAQLTGIENLRFVCRIYGRDIDQVADFVADFSELGAAMHEPVSTLSSGMRQRLAFGLSMAIDFETYIVDESLAAGDKAFQEKAFRAFDARREFSDVLMTSHSLFMIKQFCTRGGVLHGGSLTIFDTVDEAAEFYKQVSA